MSFNWLKNFQQDLEKGSNYAQKTLDAYRLGIRSGGSIVGVRVEWGACCPAADLDPDTIYHPDDAPPIPMTGCRLGTGCQSVYRPVMAYQVAPERAAALKEDARQREEARKQAQRDARRRNKDP